MTKEQQIEKLANILDDAKIRALGTIGSLNKGWGMWYATALYNAGYRKVDEDGTKTANLARELIEAKNKISKLKAENEQLKHFNDKLCQGIYYGDGEHLCVKIKQAKTEAVHKFAEKLKEKTEPIYDTKNVLLTKIIYEKTIDELLEEYVKA